ncbi:hypothetical protein [Wolbachia endosymbiont (group A) of Bibio marci]|uniref:hypothetical protein n=1 Tax=Wolbachia endosymbiont (group A) of Bibio marci TaxID=2953987 RepID=UPI00222F4608|nr:hypothetical protein [Wolbachia endosymbiont (group A) of Bibio marci]
METYMLTNSTETVSLIGTSSNLNISPSDNNPISDTKNVPKSTIETSPDQSVSDDSYAVEKGLPDNAPKLAPGERPFTGTKDTRDCSKVIDLDDEETRRKFFFAAETDKEGQNEHRGKYVVGKVLDEVISEVKKHFPHYKAVNLRTGRKPGKPELTARVMLDNIQEGINIAKFLNSDVCKQYNIKAFTLLLPPSEKRGIRLRIDEHGTKIYEVANGSYEMTLKWHVEGKECNIKINIYDNGSVELIESNGVTKEQLAANNLKIRRQYEAKPLHEALVSQLPQTQLQQGSEVVKVLPQSSQVQQM